MSEHTNPDTSLIRNDDAILDDDTFEARLDDLVAVAEDIERLQTVVRGLKEPSPLLTLLVERLVERRHGMHHLGAAMKKLVKTIRVEDERAPDDPKVDDDDLGDLPDDDLGDLPDDVSTLEGLLRAEVEGALRDVEALRRLTELMERRRVTSYRLALKLRRRVGDEQRGLDD
jgi:hypothetical protein